MKRWIALAVCLLPLVTLACESGGRPYCEQQIMKLITYRADAIASAFGGFSGDMPSELNVRFVRMKDPEFSHLPADVNYDPEQHLFLLSRNVVNAAVPYPLEWAVYYWPYYEDEMHRETFPIIEAIDNALWSAYLQSAARQRGLTWPHADCSSVEIEKRLPCEMVVTGIARFVKVRAPLLFNENRLDRVWPENFSAFNRRGLTYQHRDYRDVVRYGGLSLVRTLINEFGVPRVFAYVAQVPFVIEQNNVRISALKYQERAREVLRASREPAEQRPPAQTAQTQTVQTQKTQTPPPPLVRNRQWDEEARRRSFEDISGIRTGRDRQLMPMR